MKVLVAHNFYQQPGGEDQVFRSELALLESRGHEPLKFELHNDDVRGMGKLTLLGATVWHRAPARRIALLVREHRVDLVHFHNTFPLMSPAVYSAARGAGAAVVQTLHNFRLLCVQAMFLHENRVCEDCIGRVPWRGVARRCYHDSTLQSATGSNQDTFSFQYASYRPTRTDRPDGSYTTFTYQDATYPLSQTATTSAGGVTTTWFDGFGRTGAGPCRPTKIFI